MSEIDNDRGEVFSYLMTHPGGPVNLSTAHVSQGMVQKNYVVIHQAPPVVVKDIVTRFKMVGLGKDGLLIPLAD